MAKSLFLDGNVLLGSETIYPTTLRISEDWKRKRVNIFENTKVPPWTDYEPIDTVEMKFSVEGFMDLESAYPARGELLSPTTITFEGYEYDGDAIIHSFTIDAVFDAAVRVKFDAVFAGIVSITEV